MVKTLKAINIAFIAPLVFPARIAIRIAQEAADFETEVIRLRVLTGQTKEETKAVINQSPGLTKLDAARRLREAMELIL